MALEAYRAKRDFTATPEPKGGRRRRRGRSFVIQKHAARRLHYDLRLEDEGVLRSWAVTRGPSLVPGEKRLAVQVEDHPLEYGDFEGTIPKGEYGGGAVIVWDRGSWKPVGDAEKGLAKGHLEFELDGDKLHGRWHLVRMAGKPREKRVNWLLIKGDDAFARDADDPDILEERPESVKTGRAVEEVAGEPPGWSSKTGRIERAKPPKGARQAPFPGFVEPELATLRPAPPSGSRWVHEIKFDGYRLQAHVRGGEARLLTRSGLDWSERFGSAVPAALAALPVGEAILDGELVVETARGESDFGALQADLAEGRTDRFLFYAFDLLYLDGWDWRGAPLGERKARLEALLAGCVPVLRYSEHFEEEGEIILRHACRLSLEGVVSKLAARPYRSGRSGDWVKSKCAERQEFVVAGYVPSTTAPDAIGSLVLGQWDAGRLVHAGRVGTGFSAKVARELFRRLEGIRREGAPFAERLSADARRNVRWVEPELVAEVEFRAWTADGLVRHASFRGLREDKPAAEVVREGDRPAEAPRPAVTVRLTHPDRVYWKDAGVTKEGLAAYYSEVWRWMAPRVVHRPLALLRCPEGTAKQCFVQKHAWRGQSKHIEVRPDPIEGETVLAIGDLDGLIALVQGAALEVHTWQATVDDLERPDQIVMDLDPGEGVPWERVIAGAREVRERLEAAGLAAFVKTSGGKGLHVVAPLHPEAGWGAVKEFARGIAAAMASDTPDRFVATIAKSKRKGRILVDYLRNARGSLAVAPYSSRARDGAPVSMPLTWDELDPGIGPAYFTVRNAPARMLNLASDPWGDFDASRAPLAGAQRRAV
jgi:bifunctional non-homologous end joining protein LigD